MAGNISGTIKIDGESEYRKALALIRQELRETGSALNAISSSFENSDKSEKAVTNTTEKYRAVLEKQKSLYKELKGQQNEYADAVAKSQAKIAALTRERDAESNKLVTIEKNLGKTSKEYKDQAKVVADLQKQIDSENKELDRNQKSLSSVKTSMNNTETAINKTTKEMDYLGKETKEAGEEAEKASKGGFTVMKGVLANLASQGITAALNGIKSLAVAIVNLGKNAVENFANYEQLIGGVETLFGQSSKVVEDYANNAYKTAGLNANQYMETITGFSASLLQSLGGDTEKVAQVSDMAVKDMADNSNKLGTSMESIQNAYQGFAKNNYTLLDNLKLGFGGTKTEMERLLAEAEKISGIHYDISNLSDVFNAIHVIQGELKITGTTAAEAEKTIEGSMKATKSAWQNLLTGLAKGGDLTPLINNLVEGVLNLSKNLIPVVKNVITGIGSFTSGLLSTILPQIVKEIPPLIKSTLPLLMNAVSSALDSILSVLPTVIDSINSFLPQIVSALLSLLPKLIQVGIQAINSLIKGISQVAPQLIKTLPEILEQCLTALYSNFPDVVKSGLDLLLNLTKGIISAIPQLVKAIPTIIKTIVTTLSSRWADISKAGIDILIALINGIVSAMPELIRMLPGIVVTIAQTLVQNLPLLVRTGFELIGALIQGLFSMMGNVGNAAYQIGQVILQALWSLPGQIWNIGVNIVQGLWNGISSSLNWIKNKIGEWVGNVFDFIKKLFGIASPSKLFRDEIGKNLALGIGEGFSDEMKTVTSEMKDSIPSNWDLDGQLNRAQTTKEDSAAIFSFTEAVKAFKEALSDMVVEMDDENMGKFVRKTVEKAIYA